MMKTTRKWYHPVEALTSCKMNPFCTGSVLHGDDPDLMPVRRRQVPA